MEDLKPCPFCGASDTSDVYVDRLQNDGRRWAVRCDALDCIVEGPHRATKREAITAWNTRTDVSNALIAAAYEAAAQTAEQASEHYVAMAIEKLNGGHARAAFDAATRASKIEGMREAAEAVRDSRPIKGSQLIEVTDTDASKIITALIEELETAK